MTGPAGIVWDVRVSALNAHRCATASPLVKLSGEALMGEAGFGIDVAVLDRIAADIAEARDLGAKLCLVIGGGNIFRGLAGAAGGMDRVSGDYMGMLATVMNALALRRRA